MKRLTLTLFAVIFAATALAQTNPIVGSNHWQAHDPSWGGFQLRHVARDAIGAKVNVNNIVHGDGLAVIVDQLTRAKQAGAFTLHRTMYNYHRVNKADQVGLTFRQITHWDGSIAWIVDYDNPQNLVIIEQIENSVAEAAGHLIDGITLGWGILQEANFGGNPPPVSTEGMYQYFLVMNRVWGNRLFVNIGGSYGSPENPAWTRKILTRIAESGHSFLGEFQDSYGQEIWDTQYHFAYEIWESAGVERPLISWREVTGGCNQWQTHPSVRATPAELYAEFVERQYSFLHNMGCWPIYDGTDQFITNVMAYLPGHIEAYREAIGYDGSIPPPPEPPPLDSLKVRVSLLEQQMRALQDWVQSGSNLVPVEQ